MRFFADGPAIPDVLMERCDAGRVVFLCGAGVSFNSGMPTFLGLTKHVIDFFDPPQYSEIMKAFDPWRADPTAANVPLDQIFNLLHQEYGRDEVNALVTERLLIPSTSETVGYEHGLIKRISSNQRGVPQIVTTNFDHLFEFGDEAGGIPTHIPPAFPDLTFGSPIDGITYLHGRLVARNATQHPYVLSSADFGRAYLSEAWATKFISGLLERYTVVLVGYQAEDPPVKYLLQGLNHDGQFDRTRLYAFDRGEPEAIEAKWRDRGVTAIAYQDHPHLWRSMEAWAERADDPRAWRSRVVASAQLDPKEMSPHERGQVAHILRSVPGAKAFANAEPSPHPEWVCVLDAFVRNAKKSSGYHEEAEEFDPVLAYGLDDDLGPISDEDSRRGIRNDNLLEWRNGDDNPPDFHRLGSRQLEGHEAMPTRLWHLIRWIGKSSQSPVIAWWAARQLGLHPRLIDQIARHLDQAKDLDENCRRIWNLILEHHRDPRNRRWHGRWYDLKKRVAEEGWVPSVLRDFQNAATPCLHKKGPMGLHENKPPTSEWGELCIEEIARFEVKYLERHGEDLGVPDEAVPAVFGLLENQLIIAAGLLSDLGVSYFTTPTCFPDRETDGGEQYHDSAEQFLLFIEFFNRLVALAPQRATAHAMFWDERDEYFFRKLKLYALSKPELFDANDAAGIIAGFDQATFWDNDVVRELLFTLVDRWQELSDESKEALAERIVAGPDQRDYWSDEEYPSLRDRTAARYGRYLQLNGCDLPDAAATRLAQIITEIPDWTDGRATATVIEHGIHAGFVETDETPDEIIDLPVDEIVDRAQADSPRRFPDLTERRPFTGLVKANPRKALSSLSVAAKKGDYPKALWAVMIVELPVNIAPRLRRAFLLRVAGLPHPTVIQLRHTLGRWLEQNLVRVLEFDHDLGWMVFDHVVDGILSGGANAAVSGLGEVRRAGEVTGRSRRTYGHAINGPLGMCAKALFQTLPGKNQEAGSLVPEYIKGRLERLFAAPGEGSDHAVSITTRRLNLLMHIDPDWTKERLLPLLAYDHPASEPAWNGFLHSPRVPWAPLAEVIKPLMLDLFPRVEDFSWDRNLSKVAAQWLGFMRVFHPDEPGGLTKVEMRSVLRAMSDGSRNQFIFWLGRVGQKNEDGWVKHVVPFVRENWPRERQSRTSGSVRAWISMLDHTGNDLPAVYEVVKEFLVSVDEDNLPFYRFFREQGEQEPLGTQFPEVTLDLLHRVTPSELARPHYDLPKMLALICEAEPSLAADYRYLRLIDLLERS
ncbi:SIR2 family protein [Rhodobacter sp. NTK016B]|uniref:SIR2 family protein n=1 Tax=Rhodobacter sp. NTK016B TaxID=2759676 RepID=UPI001A906C4F|nr:SIR2 family protein [Rhodobacter sp. NTK016B]MBN8291008.1 SIR2 family protein [Rhodobacter sp. NTK016B]